MLGSVVQRFLCRRYSSLLAAYSEASLDSTTRARVAAHLSSCPNCRAERVEIEAVATLLRKHPPVAAAPSTDLWAKLEARIQAEAPRQEVVFIPQPEPRFAWDAFVRSFASAGAVVSVAVVCMLAVLQKGLEIYPRTHATDVILQAKTLSQPDTVTISLLPQKTGDGIGKHAPINALSPALAAMPRIASRPNGEAVKSVVAESINQAPSSFVPSVNSIKRSSPVRLSVVSESRSRRGVAPKANVSLRFVANSQRPVAASTPNIADTSTRAAASSMNLSEVKDGSLTSVTAQEDSLTRDSNYAFASTTTTEGAKEETHTADSAARLPLRQVAWVPDAELERRAVPASASAADPLMQERQRQTLFSYSR